MAAVELFFFYLFGAAAPLSLAALNAGMAGMALFFLWRLATGKYKPRLPEWLLLVFIAWNLISAVSGPMPGKSLHGMLNFWSWCALFIAAALPIGIRKRWRQFALFLSISMAFTLPISLCTFIIGTNFHHQRLFSHRPMGTVCSYGFFSHHLTYAGMLILVFSISTALLFYGGKRRGWWSIASVVSFINIVLSQARGYYVAFIPTLFVLLWHKGKKWLITISVITAMAIGLLVIAGPSSFKTRLKNTWNLQNASNAERIYLWISGLEMVGVRPVAGWGPGIYKDTAGVYKAPYASKIHYPTHDGFQTVSHAHNLFLMVTIQSGIVGLILFLAFIAGAFREILKRGDPAIKYGAIAAFTAFLVGGLFEYNGGDAEVAMLLFFIVGLALRDSDEPVVKAEDMVQGSEPAPARE